MTANEQLVKIQKGLNIRIEDIKNIYKHNTKCMGAYKHDLVMWIESEIDKAFQQIQSLFSEQEKEIEALKGELYGYRTIGNKKIPLNKKIERLKR